MTSEKIYVNKIPAIIWGEKTEKVYIYVHGKMSNEESAEHFVKMANSKGVQTISFDLPEHSEHPFGTKEDGEIVEQWLLEYT